MKHLTTVVLLSALCLLGCSPLSISVEEDNPWTHLNFNNNPKDFQFAVVGDRTGGLRPGVFRDAMRRINLLQPEFVMSVGDLIGGSTDEQPKLDSEWKEFNAFVASLDMPFFYTVGNHDISNAHMVTDWERRFGRSYYHFVYRDALFIVLNTEDPPIDELGHDKGHMGKEQIAWLKGVMSMHRGVRWTFVFMHKPMMTYGDKSNWDEIAVAFHGRERVTFFAGHHHAYTKGSVNGRDVLRLATTGGGSGLEGPRKGSVDHVTWVTVKDDGPIVANLFLGGIWTNDIRGEAKALASKAHVEGRQIHGHVAAITDHWFNINTDVSATMLGDAGIYRGSPFEVTYAGTTVRATLAKDYSDVPKGDWVGLIRASGNLQIAISFGHAAKVLKCNVDDELIIRPVPYAE